MDPEKLEALRRNSGLALTRDGVWMWGTQLVENPRVQAMFHRGVGVRADGEVTLSIGHMWAYVACPGPAFFVAALTHREGDAGSTLRLLGDREVPLFAGGGAQPVAGWGPDERLYLWVDGIGGEVGGGQGRVAICLRDAHQTFAARLQDGPEGLELVMGSGDATGERPGLRAHDHRIPVVMLATIPSASAIRPT